MNYTEIYESYSELKDILIKKNKAIIKKDLEELSKLDEATLIVTEKIKKIDFNAVSDTLSKEEKENLKKLGVEIKEAENNNEMLIKHSLGVINNILHGILNIVQSDKNSYNAQGKGCINSESLNISSVTEEA